MNSDFLFIHYGYDHNLAPSLTLHKDGTEQFEYLSPRGQNITLAFDTSARACTGWHDLATSESFPCPDRAMLPTQFNHCRHCQNKTGFNPAFYHATSVSPQQQARNAEPHFLYLAHFAPGVVKVGISWAERGLRRLLDQGARSALILKTYPSATIARQYEAKVAALPGIAETLQIKTKHKLLGFTYDVVAAANELCAARQRLTTECNMQPEDNEPVSLDSYYLSDHTINQPVILNGEQKISGHCLGMIGSTLITEQNDQQYGLCVNNFTGYRVNISDVLNPNTHRPQQASLF
ncbi:MAG TPA: DUF2797 domain-containing protein [Magnetospirillaceae bacterium]|nr:DUF2797 domain-containing protein [Magnetospirillaceae bacterium]